MKLKLQITAVLMLLITLTAAAQEENSRALFDLSPKLVIVSLYFFDSLLFLGKFSLLNRFSAFFHLLNAF